MTTPRLTFFQSVVASSTTCILLPKAVSYLPFPNFFKTVARLGSLGMLLGSASSQFSVHSLKNSKPFTNPEILRKKATRAIEAIESIAVPLLVSQLCVLDNFWNGALVFTAGMLFTLSHRQLTALNQENI